eukprot:TRINITY_DN27671_c0_g1_i1.p1 TRINITY_DN27671_c0_g1~~TRINITY_DN27671_c0_g1_i1.p1  ORF type:complete len:938 (-),score=136.39 TRINITY_DN27671_c0_g1_i1:29-2842(-)
MSALACREFCFWTLIANQMAPVLTLLEPTGLEFEEFPNLLAGSFTDGQKFSTGNTLPLIGRPWGFNHWSPQTSDGKTSWWFRGDAHEFHWIRMTHQPSPWIGDWGFLFIGPQMGGVVGEPVMFFEPWAARMKPHVFDAMLGPDNIRVQLTPTMHAAILTVTFPTVNPNGIGKRVCLKLPAKPTGKESHLPRGSIEIVNEDGLTLGFKSERANDVPRGFAMYIRAEVDKTSLQFGASISAQNDGDMRCFEFSPKETDVTVRIASSLISFEQAKLNLDREVGGRHFEEVERESRDIWRELLGRVDVVDPGPLSQKVSERLEIFYTGLYRALTFPRRLDEIDASGKTVHYSPYSPNGGVFPGTLVTDNGFWDTFRTVYPLLSLAYPEEASWIVTGWLNAFKEGSWLPEWASPGYRSCMVGTYADVVVADAIIKDILPPSEYNTAWDAFVRDSFQMGRAKGTAGKASYDVYSQYGYIPIERNGDAASATLDFAYSDFAVSIAATKLEKTDKAAELRNRAVNARRHCFDRGSGLFRAKTQGGGFRGDPPHSWGNGFVEGASWQHSFPAFDLPGFVELHGSREALARKILQMLSEPGSFQPGSYRQTIHEMEEMRALAMGQYSHSNQPVHHILWLLLSLDQASPSCSALVPPATDDSGVLCPRIAGERAIHKTLTRAYSTHFYSGDEDNGEMGAWYVLAALGLFEPAPGTNHGYVLGSPLFRRVHLYRKPRSDVASRPDLTILSSKAGGPDVRHVSRVLLDDKDVGRPGEGTSIGWTISYQELFQKSASARLIFLTGDETPESAAQAEKEPPAKSAPAISPAPKASSVLPQKRQQLENAADLQQQAVLKSQLQEQQLRIRALERRIASSDAQAKVDMEMHSGLTNHFQIAFLILITLNVAGWFVCTCQRRSQAAGNSTKQKSRNRVQPGKSRAEPRSSPRDAV